MNHTIAQVLDIVQAKRGELGLVNFHVGMHVAWLRCVFECVTG